MDLWKIYRRIEMEFAGVKVFGGVWTSEVGDARRETLPQNTLVLHSRDFCFVINTPSRLLFSNLILTLLPLQL